MSDEARRHSRPDDRDHATDAPKMARVHPTGTLPDTLPPATPGSISDFPTLETDRLVLREIVPDDAEMVYRILGNPAVMRLSGSDPLPNIGAATSVIERFATCRASGSLNVRWGIQLKDHPELIGTCGLFGWNRGWHKCSAGYELGLEWQNKGFMREALRAVLTWGFYEMLLHRVEAQVHPANSRSINLMRSLGFVQEGLLREAAHWGGEIHDMAQFGLLWQELR